MNETNTSKNGKFEKNLSKNAKNKWHKADFTNCKQKGE